MIYECQIKTGVYTQQSAERRGCVRDQVLCELFLHADGRFHHMRTHSRDPHYDLTSSTPLVPHGNSDDYDSASSSSSPQRKKSSGIASWWRAATAPAIPASTSHQSAIANSDFTTPRRSNTLGSTWSLSPGASKGNHKTNPGIDSPNDHEVWLDKTQHFIIHIFDG